MDDLTLYGDTHITIRCTRAGAVALILATAIWLYDQAGKS